MVHETKVELNILTREYRRSRIHTIPDKVKPSPEYWTLALRKITQKIPSNMFLELCFGFFSLITTPIIQLVEPMLFAVMFVAYFLRNQLALQHQVYHHESLTVKLFTSFG